MSVMPEQLNFQGNTALVRNEPKMFKTTSQGGFGGTGSILIDDAGQM